MQALTLLMTIINRNSNVVKYAVNACNMKLSVMHLFTIKKRELKEMQNH